MTFNMLLTVALVLADDNRIIVDGSSTVFPLSEAVAEDYQAKNKKLRIAVAVSGTGGGFKKFCKGEVDITGASRPIEKSEMELCQKNKPKEIQFIELPVTYDGITVVVHPENNWVMDLSVAELKAIWAPDSKIKNWKDVRKGFPDRKLSLYGPGHDSGTFDYFTHAIVGKEKSSRADFMAAEDDNMIVRGVSNDKGSLGYFGFSYYEANQSRLKAVAIKPTLNQAALLPSVDTIRTAQYQPLSRPLFIYVSKDSLARKVVSDFVVYYLDQAPRLSPQVGYVPLPSKLYEDVHRRFSTGVAGTLFKDSASRLLSLEVLLSKKPAEKAH